jgi:pimeloyl-ACP methyl ester carboxylesterase
VFVHGIFGNSVDTWTTGTSYWPDLISKDPTFDGADIYVLQYPSKRNTTFSIDELSDSMRLRLRDAGIEDKKRIIFLAHSMGGLVARAYLLKYKDIAPHISFMYFLSTPTTGSQLASLVSLASSQPQLVDMKVDISNAYLGNLVRQWLAAGVEFPSYCAYEKRATFGINVVTFESGSALCNKALDPIDADHFSIAKPADQDADVYVAFRNAFQQSGRRVDVRFKQLSETVQFGATTLDYAKSLLGQPVWEKSNTAKFVLDGYVAFIKYETDADGSKRIVGLQAEQSLKKPSSSMLASGAPFDIIDNGKRLGVSDRPLGLATYSDFGVVNRIGLNPDPLRNPLRCNEIYGPAQAGAQLGMCCLAPQSPGIGTIMELWTYIDMPENWAPTALSTPTQRLVVQLANNDAYAGDVRKDWRTRTEESYCERQYLSQSEEDEARKHSYNEVPDEEIIQTLRDTRVDGIAFFNYKINAPGKWCRGTGSCDAAARQTFP